MSGVVGMLRQHGRLLDRGGLLFCQDPGRCEREHSLKYALKRLLMCDAYVMCLGGGDSRDLCLPSKIEEGGGEGEERRYSFPF